MPCGTCGVPRAAPSRLTRRKRAALPTALGAPGEAGAPSILDTPGAAIDTTAIVQAINSLAGLLAPTDSHVLTFSRSIPAATANAELQRVPFDAYIVAVFIHFPPGASQLVEVRLTAEVAGSLRYILPSKEDAYIALDDSFIPFLGLRFLIPAGSTLRAEWYNYDGANSHTVPITVVIAIVGRAGGVALPPSEFVPALERPRVPPTVAPEPIRVIPPAFRPPEVTPPPLLPVPIVPIPSPTAPPLTMPIPEVPSVSRMNVAISPRTTRAEPGAAREVTLGFTGVFR